MAVDAGVITVPTTAAKVAAPTAAPGGLLSSISAKTAAIVLTPAFGLFALAGVIAWELWQAKKDETAIAEKKAAALQA